MNNVIKLGLGVAGLLLAVSIISVLFLPSYLEDNIDALQSDISASLGRPVHFEQGIELQWSLTPSIAIKGVRIGNPHWAKAEHLISAEHAVLQFGLAGLFARRLDISELTLNKADLVLESSKEGKQNWQFDSDKSSDTSVLPERINISDSRLRYRPAEGKEHLITIARFEIEGLSGRAIDAEADIQYDDLPISISMEPDSRVVIETHGKQAESFRVTARLNKDDQFLELKDIEIKAGDDVLTGEVRLPISGGKQLAFNLSADSLDITPYFAKGNAGGNGIKNFLGHELDPGSVKGFTGQLHMGVKQLKVGDILLDDIKLDANINASHMQLTLKDSAGKLDTNIDIKPAGSLWQLEYRQQSSVDIGQVIEADSDQASRTQAKAALDVNLSGSGKSLQGILGSSQGSMSLKIGAGRLSKAMSALLPMGSVLDSLLTTLSTEDSSRLECAVLIMDVKEGVASSKNGLAVRTPAVNVLGGGSLKLATGEIDFHFKTVRRKGVGVSVKGIAENFVHLTGTLREPKGEVNTAGFLLHGGGAWATGGATLFYDSLVKRLSSSSNPCEAVQKSP